MKELIEERRNRRIDALVDAGFATVSRNPSDHEASVAYRHAIGLEMDRADKWARTATDRQYMINALVELLGPNALKLWQGWQAQGLIRVHHSWGPGVAELSGEERAAHLLAWEEAPSELIHNVDAPNPHDRTAAKDR